MISMRFSSVVRMITTVCAICAGLEYAYAREISSTEAGLAVGAWARSGRTLRNGARLSVSSVATHMATNGIYFHAVKLVNGGTVFTTADSDLEPVIAFTDSTNDFSKIDHNSTLWHLLSRDVQVRTAYAKLARQPILSSATALSRAAARERTAPIAMTATANAKWVSLLQSAKKGSVQGLVTPATTVAPNNFKSIPADLRVPQMLRSKWSQNRDRDPNGAYCYDYHTPNHDPCGCTATATAQIMRYWEMPKTDIGQLERACTVDGKIKMLTTIGGVYDWSLMTLDPASVSVNPEANREMIGRLCYDVGVLLLSDYGSVGTSSVLYKVPRVLLENAGFANAVAYYDKAAWGAIRDDGYGTTGGLHEAAMREKTIFASLDAGAPVALGIYGFPAGKIGDFNYWSGHAVVGDGYGYAIYDGESVPYVHVNLGWAGADDAWYNLPEINCASTGAYAGSSGTDFTVLGMVLYNAFPDRIGQVLAGRVYDAEGEGIEGATVTLTLAASGEVVAVTNTSASGIYAFVVPGSVDYKVKAEFEGLTGSPEEEVISLKADVLTVDDSDGYKYVQRQSDVGNSWGNDIELSNPSVRIEGGDTFTSLHKALAAVQEGDTVTVFGNTRFRGAMDIGVNCRIVAEGTPTVRCSAGSSLRVKAGINVSIEGITFTNELAQLTVQASNATMGVGGNLTVMNTTFGGIKALNIGTNGKMDFSNVSIDTLGAIENDGVLSVDNGVFGGTFPIRILANGSVALSEATFSTGGIVTTVEGGGKVTLGSGVSGLLKIIFADGGADSFTLAGMLTEPIDIDCAAASGNGDVFGRWTGDESTAKSSAPYLANILDKEGDLGGAAREDGMLVWQPISWSRDQATCYTVIGGITNYYKKLNSLLRYNYKADADVEVVVYGEREDSLVLKEAFELQGQFNLYSDADHGFVIRMTDAASFTLAEGASLTVKDIVFDGSGALFKQSFINIAGGSFNLNSGAIITNAVFDYCSGAVELCGGEMTMESGATIADCHLDPIDYAMSDRHGGAINIYEGVFKMVGGTITNCTVDALECGGGVYVMSSFYDARMEVSGDAVVSGCKSGSGTQVVADNVNWGTDYAGVCGLVLAGPFTGRVGVLAFDEDSILMNSTNDVFAAVAEEVRNDVALPMYAARFINDHDSRNFVGTNATDGATLIWAGRTFTYKRDPFDLDVILRVIPDAGGVTNYYADLSEAFAEIDGACTVELINPWWWVLDAGDVVMTNNIAVNYPVVLRCAEDVFPISNTQLNNEMGAYYYMSPFLRLGDYAFEVTSSLVLTNIFLDGGAWEYLGPNGWTYYEQGNLINVKGGSVTFQDNAWIGYTMSANNRAASAVTVQNGTLKMEPNSGIISCGNYYKSDSGEGNGGAILSDYAQVILDGATIMDCVAGDGGGIFLANESQAYIKGKTLVLNNHRGYYDTEKNDLGEWPFIKEEVENNITLADSASKLYLMDALGDTVGITHGWAQSETNVFGYVANVNAGLEALAYSATNFVNDVTHARGTMLTNGMSQAILIWWNAAYTNTEGFVEYDWAPSGEQVVHYVEVVKNAQPDPVDPPEPDPIYPNPVAFESITKNNDGSWTLVLTNMVTGCKYRILGTANLATGFGETVKDWITAERDGPWTNKVEGVGAQHFWKAEAKGSLE